MEWFVATCDLAAIAAIVLFVFVYAGYRVIHGIRVYARFRGPTLVTCPETHTDAAVQVAAWSMGMQAILEEPCLRLKACSRWPRRGGGSAQDCLGEIETNPSELRNSGGCRAL